jgi:hypothetical protein
LRGNNAANTPFRASYRIPALAKRNKINLLKIPGTLQQYGPYLLLSELGDKGEGAIQSVKPVLAKAQGMRLDNWAEHVSIGVNSRRYSRIAISLVLDAIRTGPESQGEDKLYSDAVTKAFGNIAPPSMRSPGLSETKNQPGDAQTHDEEWTTILDDVEEYSPPRATTGRRSRRRMYFTYKSKHIAEATLLSGNEPTSVVIHVVLGHNFEPQNQYAIAYRDTRGAVRLINIGPNEFVISRCGAAFFRWQLVPGVADKSIADVTITDYGLMLPWLAQYENVEVSVYYFITYWWLELQANGRLEKYRPVTP